MPQQWGIFHYYFLYQTLSIHKPGLHSEHSYFSLLCFRSIKNILPNTHTCDRNKCGDKFTIYGQYYYYKTTSLCHHVIHVTTTVVEHTQWIVTLTLRLYDIRDTSSHKRRYTSRCPVAHTRPRHNHCYRTTGFGVRLRHHVIHVMAGSSRGARVRKLR